MIKKYWYWFALFAMAGVCFYFYLNSEDAIAIAAAAKEHDKIISQAAAEQKTMTDYYKKANEELTNKISDNNQVIDETAEDSRDKQAKLDAAQREIAKLKTCAEREIALNFTLTDCRTTLTKTTTDFLGQIDDLNLSWTGLINSKDRQINELDVKLYGLKDDTGKTIQPGCTDKLADTTAELVKIKVTMARKSKVILFAGVAIGFILKSCLK